MMTVDFGILSHPEFEPAPIIPTSSRTVKSIGVLWYLEQSGRCLQHCRRSNRGYNNLWGKSLWLDFLPGALRVINNSDGTPRSLITKPWINPNPSLALNSYVWLQMITSLFSWASLDIIFLLFFSRFISNWRHQRSLTFFKNGWKQGKKPGSPILQQLIPDDQDRRTGAWDPRQSDLLDDYRQFLCIPHRILRKCYHFLDHYHHDHILK